MSSRVVNGTTILRGYLYDATHEAGGASLAYRRNAILKAVTEGQAVASAATFSSSTTGGVVTSVMDVIQPVFPPSFNVTRTPFRCCRH